MADNEEFTEIAAEVISNLKTLTTDRTSYYNRDDTDITTARSYSSGFGFSEDDKAYRGEIKPEVYLNVIMAWRDQLVAKYNADPFHLGVKNIKPNNLLPVAKAIVDEVQVSSKLSLLIPDIFKKLVDEGFTYGILYTDVINSETNEQSLKFRTIDARKVIVDTCDDPTLADVRKVAVIDVVSKAEMKETYEGVSKLLEYSSDKSDIFVPNNIDYDSKTQCILYTFYEKVSEGVRISKVLYNEVLDSVVVKLSRIPVFRFYGESVYIDSTIHYRGIYHFVADLIKLLNYTASELQHKIATTPSARWLADSKSIAENADTFSPGTDSIVAEYNSHDGSNELKIPQLLDVDLKSSGYISTINSFMTIIKDIIGNPSGDSRSNETAEAVLTRKDIAKATSNKFVVNLQNTLVEVGKVILEYVGMIYDIPRYLENGIQLPVITSVDGLKIEVLAGPLEADRKKDILQAILAFNSIVVTNSANPEAMKMLPFIAKYLPIPEEDKQQLFGMFGGNTNPMQQQMVQLGQANQQLTVQNQQMTQQLAMVQKQLQDSQQYIQTLTNMLQAEESKVRADLLKTQMNNKNDLEVALIKEKGLNERKQLEIEAKAAQEVIKAQGKLEESFDIPMGNEVVAPIPMNRGSVL